MKLQVRLASVLALSVLWVILAVPSAWAQGAAGATSSLRQSLGIDKLIKDSPLAQQIVGQLSDEDLQALAAGADPATIKPLINLSLDVNANLVFTPVTPCRLIDTRVPVPIPFSGGETRAYDLIGPTDYSSIGGNPLGCGIPGVVNFIGLVSYNIPRALVLNLVAVGAAGPGDFRAFPPEEPVPTASVINYANLSSVGLNIANGIVLKTCAIRCTGFFTCGEPCPLGDLAFLADVSGTHLVVDVVGYFSQPETVLTEGTHDEPNIVLTGACQELVTCSVLNNSGSARTALAIGSAAFRLNHGATNDRADFAVSATSADCGSGAIPAPGGGVFQVPAGLPADLYRGTVTVTKTFSVPANTIGQFFLNGQMTNGADALDEVIATNIVCLIP